MKYYTIDDLVDLATPEEHKAHLVEMMSTFDAFCKEHGLRYYLSGGTLLGAVRHKGFIPWDDDVDVNMPRPDCDKLMELSGGRIGRYVLNPPNYSGGYHAYHYKLYDDSILVAKKRGNELSGRVYPIFMDIFPIDGLPDTEEENKKFYEELIALKERCNTVWNKKPYMGRDPFKRKKIDAEYNRLRQIGIEQLFNDVVAHQTKIGFDNSDYVGVTSTNVHNEEERVVKAEYMPVVEVEFEGRKFPAPKGWKQYLKQLYGPNFMELPPVYTRISRHGLIPFRSKGQLFNDEQTFDWDTWQKTWCKGEPDITIAICGLVKSDNLGELFIARSLEYLIGTELRKIYPDIQIRFKEVDLLARNDQTISALGTVDRRVTNYSNFDTRFMGTEQVMLALKNRAGKQKNRVLANSMHRARHLVWKHGANYKKRLDGFFDERLAGSDFIVVDGAGLLEYSYNEYEWPLLEISEYAEKHGLSIVYNAIGRAGEFDPDDFRCKILMKALRSDAIKYISARDNPDQVAACTGGKHKVKLLADAAFCMNETYPPLKEEERKKIGIGLIRGNSLTEYGANFHESDWVKLFSKIARTLEKRGYEYEFFTNGLQSDIEMGRKVIEKMGISGDAMLMRPTDDYELYSTINRYAGIITCRMHSCIAAFTLKVPSVVLSWNDKVDELMKNIGYPDRVITKDAFKADYIVDCMEKAIAEGVEDDKLEAMKAKARESVQDYIGLIAEVAEKKMKGKE
ncbi:MAG: LicD family protein [Mogibacterium sp.]|nr:LicD family protein [Mogibacterium sp.]MBQ6501014.1 LicD family protein [Mogibacterium sp.]